jgi:hypothetical protein
MLRRRRPPTGDAGPRAIGGLRFFADVVMAFAAVLIGPSTSSTFTSNAARRPEGRDISAATSSTQFLDRRLRPDRRGTAPGAGAAPHAGRLALDARLRIDGIRMDSVPNIMSWDFVQDYRILRETAPRWRRRAGEGPTNASSVGGIRCRRFVAAAPRRPRNEEFKRMVRSRSSDRTTEGAELEWTVVS